ncbi:hypothetical protein J3E68DRAFT_269509 [Trichoderma sp. SZMC 28012]
MVACLMSRPCVRCAENSEGKKQRRRLRAMPDERSSSDIREWPCRIPCPYQVATVATVAILEELQSPRNLGRQIRGVWFSGISLYDPYEQFVLCCMWKAVTGVLDSHSPSRQPLAPGCSNAVISTVCPLLSFPISPHSYTPPLPFV